MRSISEILDKMLKEIIPTNKELTLINKIVERLKLILEKKAKELKIEYTRIEPQGSTGIKQTQLRNDFDIDLFIGLNYDIYKPKYRGLSKNKLKKESKKDFLRLCNDWIIKALDGTEFQNLRLLYAEHPYVKTDYVKKDVQIEIDIVLYFDLEVEYIKKNGPITAVDRSPWHGRFVRENLNANQKNDVRLLKQFFKSCHSYGDKSAIGRIGFIGYSAELLIYHFGSIQNVINNFENLPIKPIDYYNRTEKELSKITHFQNDYLIITDPIDPNRNVASAISEKAYKYCKYKIKKFLEDPDPSYFKIKPIPEIDLSNSDDQLKKKIFLIEFSGKRDDIHYTIYRDKLNSLADSIKANGEKEFSHNERFGKIFSNVYFEDKINEYNLAIYCDKPVISSSYLRRGPPLREISHTKNFKKKNPSFIEKNGFLWTETKRDFRNFNNFLNDIVPKKIPDYIEIKNISNALNAKTRSAKRAIFILKEMVIPFIEN